MTQLLMVIMLSCGTNNLSCQKQLINCMLADSGKKELEDKEYALARCVLKR